MLKRIGIILLPFLFTSCEVSGQVLSKGYDRMLGALLSHTVNEVSVEQLSKDVEKTILLDARAVREFEVSHLKDAIWVGYDDFNIASVKDIPKSSNIVVYCSVGYRSEKVAEKLKKAGYLHVSNLYGGIFEWKNQGNEVVNQQKTTDKVHAYNKLWGKWLNKGEKVYN